MLELLITVITAMFPTFTVNYNATTERIEIIKEKCHGAALHKALDKANTMILQYLSDNDFLDTFGIIHEDNTLYIVELQEKDELQKKVEKSTLWAFNCKFCFMPMIVSRPERINKKTKQVQNSCDDIECNKKRIALGYKNSCTFYNKDGSFPAVWKHENVTE